MKNEHRSQRLIAGVGMEPSLAASSRTVCTVNSKAMESGRIQPPVFSSVTIRQKSQNLAAARSTGMHPLPETVFAATARINNSYAYHNQIRQIRYDG